MCQILGVSKSGYYKASKHPESEEPAEEMAVIHCFQTHQGNYGRVRLRKALLKQGIDVSEYRIAKILKKNGLVAKSGRTGRKKHPKITEQQYIEENLIKDKFSVMTPNYLWCSDITEHRYKGGKLFICGVLDVATRRVVGWSIGKSQTQTLVQDAIEMAAGRNPERPEGAVFHSDRGSQYTAKRTKELVDRLGFRKSMSRPGTPSDNQPIESFWRTMKLEMPDVSSVSYADACRTIAAYIELYYNAERLHSAIDYCAPNDFVTL